MNLKLGQQSHVVCIDNEVIKQQTFPDRILYEFFTFKVPFLSDNDPMLFCGSRLSVNRFHMFSRCISLSTTPGGGMNSIDAASKGPGHFRGRSMRSNKFLNPIWGYLW